MDSLAQQQNMNRANFEAHCVMTIIFLGGALPDPMPDELAPRAQRYRTVAREARC